MAKLRCLKKHQKLLKLIEYQSRESKNRGKYSDFCENALRYFCIRRNEQLGLICLPIVHLIDSSSIPGGFTSNELTLATSHDREPYEFDDRLIDYVINRIPESINGWDLFNIDGLGVIKNYPDEEGLLSSLIFSILLCYLLDSRFKLGSSDELLDIKKRGKLFDEGYIRMLIKYQYYDNLSGNPVFFNIQNLLINIYDNKVFVDNGVRIELYQEFDYDYSFDRECEFVQER